jgi:uncharacterized membrane protein YheB (UPF0754 family)
MVVAYNRLYELLKNVKDEKEAEELCKIIERFFEEKCREEVSKKFDEQKPVFKAELKEDLKDELATKNDIALLEERMNSMEEKILRYVDNKFYELDKKTDRIFYLIVVFMIVYVLTNPQVMGVIKLIFMK